MNVFSSVFRSFCNVYTPFLAIFKPAFPVGYVEINLTKNDKYLVEIMYNYAKIEVIVGKDKINEALLTSISILKSVDYNDEIVENLFGSNVLNFTEEEFNIFNTTSSDSTYLQTDGNYEETTEEVPDTDLLN